MVELDEKKGHGEAEGPVNHMEFAVEDGVAH